MASVNAYRFQPITVRNVMSVQHIIPNQPIMSTLPTESSVKDDTENLIKENVKLPEGTPTPLATDEVKPLMTNEERSESFRKMNLRYTFDQIIRSMQVSTQEMIRQARERQKEEGE